MNYSTLIPLIKKRQINSFIKKISTCTETDIINNLCPLLKNINLSKDFICQIFELFNSKNTNLFYEFEKMNKLEKLDKIIPPIANNLCITTLIDHYYGLQRYDIVNILLNYEYNIDYQDFLKLCNNPQIIFTNKMINIIINNNSIDVNRFDKLKSKIDFNSGCTNILRSLVQKNNLQLLTIFLNHKPLITCKIFIYQNEFTIIKKLDEHGIKYSAGIHKLSELDLSYLEQIVNNKNMTMYFRKKEFESLIKIIINKKMILTIDFYKYIEHVSIKDIKLLINNKLLPVNFSVVKTILKYSFKMKYQFFEYLYKMVNITNKNILLLLTTLINTKYCYANDKLIFSFLLNEIEEKKITIDKNDLYDKIYKLNASCLKLVESWNMNTKKSTVEYFINFRQNTVGHNYFIDFYKNDGKFINELFLLSVSYHKKINKILVELVKLDGHQKTLLDEIVNNNKIVEFKFENGNYITNLVGSNIKRKSKNINKYLA